MASWVPLSQALFQLVMAAVMLCMFVAEGLHLGRLYATFTIPLENGAVIGLLVPMLLACCVTASGLAGLNWQVQVVARMLATAREMDPRRDACQGAMNVQDPPATLSVETAAVPVTHQSIITLRSWKGTYIGFKDGSSSAAAVALEADAWHRFKVWVCEGGKVALQLMANKSEAAFLSGTVGRPLYCSPNLTKEQKWEVVQLGDGRVALRSCHNTYVCAHKGGGDRVHCCAPEPREWETLAWDVVGAEL